MPAQNNARPIVKGYPYALRVEVTGGEPMFPIGCALRAQVRDYVKSETVIAELTTENGGIVRVNDTTIDIAMSPEDTAKTDNKTAVLDFVRTDPTPDVYLYVQLMIPVEIPVTKNAA